MTATTESTLSREPTVSRARSPRAPFLNRALWSRSFADARGLILGCSVVLFAFAWTFVWTVSFFKGMALVQAVKNGLPEWMHGMIPIPLDQIAKFDGMVSLGYSDPVVLFTLTIFAVARGSDIVSGQLDRGTMEMMLAQPVRRLTLFASHACVTIVGAAVIVACCWLGTWVGLALVKLPEPVLASNFIPSVINLLAFTFFLAALTSLISSFGRYRWQTISVIGGLYIPQLIIKVVSRAAPELNWLARFTFFGCFEPSTLGSGADDVWALSLQYNGLLLAMGLTAYAIAALVFCRRDLPAPL